MPNLSQVFKAEISRISRHEIKTAFKPLHQSTISLKKTIIDLKRKIASIEAANKQLLSFQKKQEPQLQVKPVEMEKARITAKTIRKLREKLGLSQAEFGKLIDVSITHVFNMEHKQGRLRFRGDTLKNILAIKGIGKREAQKRLAEIQET